MVSLKQMVRSLTTGPHDQAKQLLHIGCRGLIAGVTISLVACGSVETKPVGPLAVSSQSHEDADALLTAASFAELSGDRTKAAAGRMQAGQILLSLNEYTTAWRVFNDIDPNYLLLVDQNQYRLAVGDLALLMGEYFAAKRVLASDFLPESIPQMTVEQELHWRNNRATVFSIVDEPVTAIKEYLAIMPLLVDAEAEHTNNETIWRLLMSQPPTTLNDLSLKEKLPMLRGWYSLAAISKNNQTNIEQQYLQVESWQRQWPNHPASLTLPDDLQLLQQLVKQQPKQVALLLPLTGKYATAGEAVRDAFMAAYYSALKAGHTSPQIQVYNTDQADINALYDQAVAEGAETIIGPLQKAPLEELNLRPALPVPTLALNYLVSESLYTENLYQFGLATEDEARQIAERAWRDGHRRAMILSSNRDWGQRAARAFTDAWQALGGELAVNTEFAQQSLFSEAIERSLLVDRSKQRARDIERLTGTNMETEPRSRSDIDMIFMVANPEDARQLKPTLAFHYAGSIPVYATSQVFDPTATTTNNNDLNGIRFTTLPWFFGFSATERDALDANLPAQKNLQNLHALGVDAYRLYPRLLQLQQIGRARYYGATGELYLTAAGRIARQESIAVISGGQATLLPTVANGAVMD
ncbi:penicillin-binding protein activator [Halioxenophilus sp. WMMB6]|uniref:penicillin-binding protein activator n=1 Tax=Halioxenophilus sp. WMMB6 TaxID=3073815 RepID=UPI00295EEA65|nr:penicillin-binding protein activator [Halioxenophilus sp. WMMB6]